MKSGHGKLTLHSGMDLALEYRIAPQHFGSWCQGALIGNLAEVDHGAFAERLNFVTASGLKLVLLVTGFSDTHLTFVGEFEDAGLATAA